MRVTKATQLETKNRIIEVTRKLLADRGWSAMTMRDVARGAEIAAGTVFNYFASKEELFLALLSEVWSQGEVQWRERGIEPEEPLESCLYGLISDLFSALQPLQEAIRQVNAEGINPLLRDSPAMLALKKDHLDEVARLLVRFGHEASEWPLTHYWLLLAGALVRWARDDSAAHEVTRAFLDYMIRAFARSLDPAVLEETSS